MSSKILIFGTGSIGAVYGYLLSKAVKPSNIVCICRSNYQVATEKGFTIDSSAHGKGLNYKPKIVRTVEEAAQYGPYDYILVSVKIVATKPTYPELLRPVMKDSKTAIVLLQNGIAIETEYAKLYPNNPLLSCVVWLPVTQTSPAVFVHTGFEKLHVGTYPAEAPKEHKDAADKFVQLLKQGGGTGILHDDVQGERWIKLLGNATWNPVCALTRSRDVQFILSSKEGIVYIQNLMYEVAAVAQAAGYAQISNDLVDTQISSAKARSLPGNEPSMLADALAGRQMEVDALLGNILIIAAKYDVPCPLLSGLYAQIKALDDSYRRRSETRL